MLDPLHVAAEAASPGSSMRDNNTAPEASRTSTQDSAEVRSSTGPAAAAFWADAAGSSGGAECTVSTTALAIPAAPDEAA